MSNELNVINFQEARARRLASKPQNDFLPKPVEEIRLASRVVSNDVAKIQNRIFRWKASAFDLEFGPNLVELNNPQHIAQVLSKLNWSS